MYNQEMPYDNNIDINNILLFSEILSYLIKDVIYDILEKINS